MKKFLVGQCIWLAITAALVAAIAHPEQPGFQNVAAVLLITYTVLMCLAFLSAVSTMTKATKGEADAKAKAIADMRQYATENPEWGILRKVLSWVQRLITVCLAAYTGMVITAPLFLVIAWLGSGTGIAYRASLEKIDATEAAKQADV